MKIIGFEHIKTLIRPIESMPVSVCTIGNESEMLVEGNDKPLLTDISPGQYDKLLSGKSFLEFWILAVDHNTPTANNRLYKEDVFQEGMQRHLIKVIRKSGACPGEELHPEVKVSDPDSDKYFVTNLAQRMSRSDPKNISHWIVGVKTEDHKTYFKIRTNPSNPVIIRDISIGKFPTFSIRTMGDFSHINRDGYIEARNITVFTTDYVENPAYTKSRVISNKITLIDPSECTRSSVTLNDYTQCGNESSDVEEAINALGIESDTIEILVPKNATSDSISIGVVEKGKFDVDQFMRSSLKSIF